VAAVFAGLVLAGAAAQAQTAAWTRSVWTHLASDAKRSSAAAGGTLSLSSPSWVVSRDLSNKPIAFVGQSSPVVTRDLVLATGTVDFGDIAYLFAIDRRGGKLVWQAEIDEPRDSGFSTPAIDERGSTVIVATGETVRAFDLRSGAPLWCLVLPEQLTNCSPVVTQDLWSVNRVFVTDSDAFGTSGKLYCINISPRSGALNPYDPGDLVWCVGIGGTSGNTPAYANGRVYVAGVGDYYAWPPVPAPVLCFDVRATCTPMPLWAFTNTTDPEARFFGGVTVANGFVYAATYDFVSAPSGFNNSNLVKLNATTGALVWSHPSNRTATMPVVLPPKPGRPFPRVLLSAGLNFTGAVPALQLFEDRGNTAELVWDSPLATWIDLDGDGRIDPGEFLSIGGWTVQPAVTNSLGALTAFVGTLPPGGNGVTFPACVKLSAINLDMLPASTGFIRAEFSGAGSSPALANSNVYTIGATGLFAFGPSPFQYDVDQDGLVTIEDLISWEQGEGCRDVNLDGKATASDRDALITELRQVEY
jgi:outer membrane protein assembly factor BamB